MCRHVFLRYFHTNKLNPSQHHIKKSARARVGNPLFQAQIVPGFTRSSNIAIN